MAKLYPYSRKLGLLMAFQTAIFIALGSTYAAADVISEIGRSGSSNPAPQISTTVLGENAPCYVDRTHVVKNVPQSLAGADYILVSNDDKTQDEYSLFVTLSEDAAIYLLIDNRVGDDNAADPPTIGAGVMDWVVTAGFKQTDNEIAIDEGGNGSIDNYFTAYAKSISAGTTILQEQNDGSNRNMYFVAATGGGSGTVNDPPSVDVGSYSDLIWPDDTIKLAPDVIDDDPYGLGVLAYKWTKLSGPGSVDFVPSNTIADPCAVFSAPGHYELKLTVWDDVSQTGTDTLPVNIFIPSVPLPGDLNNDSKVNAKDLVLFGNDWSVDQPGPADIDGDLDADFADLTALAEHWLVPPAIVINEIMARNDFGKADEQNEREDWFELHNYAPYTINVGGMYLTDDLDSPSQWQIPLNMPSVTRMGPNSHLLIWADGDVNDLGLHASFELDADDGDKIYLFDTDGVSLVDAIAFGSQTSDVAIGREPDGADNWVTLSPTPGATNNDANLPVVADTSFSHNRGFYDKPFELEIETDTPGATIRYTTDCSTPTETHGDIYSGPITISTTTCVRAMAYLDGHKATNVDTQTYIFLKDVAQQPAYPSGFPSSWMGTSGDYQVDPDITSPTGRFGSIYAATFVDDMKSVPTISLVMRKDDFFGNDGIYVDQSQDGTERVCSFEYIDPNSNDDFQINCALAMAGGVHHDGGGTSLSRWKTKKLSMRPRFKLTTDDGKHTNGPTRMNFKIFQDSPIDRHNTIVLDAVLNHSWHHSSSEQRQKVKYIQDQYVADLHNAMGGHSPHGYHAHLYIDGLYWGMYYIHERPDDAWAAGIFGGEDIEYNAVKHGDFSKPSRIINNAVGDDAVQSFMEMDSAASAVQADPMNMEKWDTLTQHLDVDNLITYLLANWYVGNADWPHKNWYATERNHPSGRWRFHSWDAEHTVDWENCYGESPFNLHGKLDANPEYKLRFADHAHAAFFNEGPLTYPRTAEQYQYRMATINRAIVGESARWGDYRQSIPHTRQDWLSWQNQMLTGGFPGRSDSVLNWLRGAGLYPSLDAPVFRVNGAYQHGGQILASDSFSITAPAGTIYYTTDGSDPRRPGGSVNMTAKTVEGGGTQVTLVPENASKRYLIPDSEINGNWRGGGYFDDSIWTLVNSGPGGIGYDTGTRYLPHLSVNLVSQLRYVNATCYIRIPFAVSRSELAGIRQLTLKIKYDDGFIAYLNGDELERRNFTGTPHYNSDADDSHSDTYAEQFQEIDVSDHLDSLGEDNVLAIHGLNTSITSGDMLISVELIADIPNDPTSSMLGKSARVKARTRSGNTWSALNEAVFSVGPVADSLRITELMFHPQLASDPRGPLQEFIELKNIGAESINLNLVKFTNGVRFTFGDLDLAGGEYTLVVRDLDAFEARYGSDLNVAGVYEGRLDNGGERVELQDAAGTIIHSFRYRDGWYDIADGHDFSLTVNSPETADPLAYDSKSNWRPSAAPGGTPGYDDAGVLPPLGAIRINEVLAHSHAAASDWIELHNTTNQPVNIGGWFLSDNDENFRKYEIAPGTVIDPCDFIVFYESSHFGNPHDPGTREPFALSENGEKVFLHSGSAGTLTGYVEEEDFGASETGVSFGRYKKSTGTYNFVPMAANTPGSPNAMPKVGPIVINEIMYHPAADGDAEYIELHNISGAPLTLQDWDNQQGLFVPWLLEDSGGLEFHFPLETTIPQDGYLLLVKDLSEFVSAYGPVPTGVQAFEWGDGKLDNGGEKLQLSRPGDLDPDGSKRYYIRVDRVNYSDGSHPEGSDPWPASPDGSGDSLSRIDPAAYGNDPINFEAAAPSPGEPNP